MASKDDRLMTSAELIDHLHETAAQKTEAPSDIIEKAKQFSKDLLLLHANLTISFPVIKLIMKQNAKVFKTNLDFLMAEGFTRKEAMEMILVFYRSGKIV